MSKLNSAIQTIYQIEKQSGRDTWLNRLHPLAKLLVTVFYILLVVSFPKYNLTGLLGMSLYLLVLFLLGEFSLSESIKRLKYILPVVCIMGILNPLFDKKPVMEVCGVMVSGGVISMVTLIVKGIFTVLAAYLLILTTSVEKICFALRKLHMPQILVTVVLLIFRYVHVLLEEAEKVTQAYALRAPKQRGIHFKAWGTLIGQFLLRSMDRANNVYESMLLRGYGMRNFCQDTESNMKFVDVAWLCVWTVLLVLLHKIPVFVWVGNLLV